MKTKKSFNRKIYRIIDANYNRAKEALRVVEDIIRFLAENRQLTRKAKLLRHQLTDIFANKKLFREMFIQREAAKDVGKPTDYLELRRKTIKDTLFANFQRAKESVRVLEELFKIIDKKNVYKFKSLRYNLYSFEKSSAQLLKFL